MHKYGSRGSGDHFFKAFCYRRSREVVHTLEARVQSKEGFFLRPGAVRLCVYAGQNNPGEREN